MAKLLFLYDTTQKDLARDCKDLFEELNISIIMIPLSPDKGFTLEDKEEHYLNEAEGAIFMLTPGSERLGSLYPSPSVTHEMGQVKQKFKTNPNNVVYLVDKDCNLPTIDQKSYILFNRNDIRSVIESITSLIRNLKDAGLYRTTPLPTQMNSSSVTIDINKLMNDIGSKIVNVLFDISNRLDGTISDKDLNDLLRIKYLMNNQQINFIKQDMEQKYSLLVHTVATEPYYLNFWWPSGIGWTVIRKEAERKKKEMPQGLGLLGGLLKSSQGQSLNIPLGGLLKPLPKKK